MTLTADDPVVHENPHWVTCALDIAGCDRLEISVPLFGQEEAGLLFDAWPPDVRNVTMSYLRKWREQHPDRAVVAITHGRDAGDQRTCCITIVHHRAAQCAC